MYSGCQMCLVNVVGYCNKIIKNDIEQIPSGELTFYISKNILIQINFAILFLIIFFFFMDSTGLVQ